MNVQHKAILIYVRFSLVLMPYSLKYNNTGTCTGASREMIKRVLSDISVSFQHKDTTLSMIPYDLHYRLPRMHSIV